MEGLIFYFVKFVGTFIKCPKLVPEKIQVNYVKKLLFATVPTCLLVTN